MIWSPEYLNMVYKHDTAIMLVHIVYKHDNNVKMVYNTY